MDINILGKIVSGTEEGIVASASQIKDDDNKKYQSEINDQTINGGFTSTGIKTINILNETKSVGKITCLKDSKNIKSVDLELGTDISEIGGGIGDIVSPAEDVVIDEFKFIAKSPLKFNLKKDVGSPINRPKDNIEFSIDTSALGSNVIKDKISDDFAQSNGNEFKIGLDPISADYPATFFIRITGDIINQNTKVKKTSFVVTFEYNFCGTYYVTDNSNDIATIRRMNRNTDYIEVEGDGDMASVTTLEGYTFSNVEFSVFSPFGDTWHY